MTTSVPSSDETNRDVTGDELASGRKPRVLIVYYTLTLQTERIANAIAGKLREHGAEVDLLKIEFNDERYPLGVPLRPFWRRLLGMIIPQVAGRTGKIQFEQPSPDTPYDFVCIGSPTWWLHPAMPVTSFLRTDEAANLLNGKPFAVFAVCRKFWSLNLRLVRKRAIRHGGRFSHGAAFRFQGGQVRSMLSFINYLQNGENRDRFWGFTIYPFGIPEEGLAQARAFGDRLWEELSPQE